MTTVPSPRQHSKLNGHLIVAYELVFFNHKLKREYLLVLVLPVLQKVLWRL